MPIPGIDVNVADPEAPAATVVGILVQHANGSTRVLPNPAAAGLVLTSVEDGDPEWDPTGVVGAPVFVQAAQPVDPPSPAVWIPLDAQGNPRPASEWQVFV